MLNRIKLALKIILGYDIIVYEENTINMSEATMLECDLAAKINEIIDYLKSKGDE